MKERRGKLNLRKLRNKTGLTIFILIVGLLIGTLIGDVLGLILPDGAVKSVMIHSLKIGFHPIVLDLQIFTLTFGFMLKINLFGIIGILVLGYILKWLY